MAFILIPVPALPLEETKTAQAEFSSAPVPWIVLASGDLDYTTQNSDTEGIWSISGGNPRVWYRIMLHNRAHGMKSADFRSLRPGRSHVLIPADIAEEFETNYHSES